MPVTTIGSAQQTPAQAPAKSGLTGGNVMGKEDFLRLLVTQLSNQDPLNPMDGQQFAAQLAQFSSVEQLINIGEGISAQQELQELQALSTSNSIAAGLIGKEVNAAGNRIQLTRPDPAAIHFDLPSNGEGVTIAIKNAAGQVVRTLDAGSLEAGAQQVSWNGQDASGAHLPDGTYTFEVSGKDLQGGEITGTPAMQGRVERVSFGPEGALLWINGLAVPLASVKSIEAPAG